MTLEVHDLEFSYSKTIILQAVNLSIDKGEFVGIFGPNGGGKTTFLQLLMGFLIPTRGFIRLFDKTPKEARSSIGYVPQVTAYDRQFPISTLDIVLMGCLSQVTKWGSFPQPVKKKALAALERVNLAHKANEPFGTLSGGQAQRALIARALVSEPKLLLLDEATASIDSKAEEEILDILRELKGTITILMVTHDLQTITQKVDKWLCINRQISTYLPHEVCGHFSHGLYHHSTLPILP